MYNLIIQSHHPLQSSKHRLLQVTAEGGDGGVAGAGVEGQREEAVLAAPEDIAQQGKVKQHAKVPFL